MAEAGLSKVANGFGQLPIIRQFGILIGLSASIALGFAVVMWSEKPEMRPAFSHLGAEETSEVLDALQSSGIPFKLDKKNGAVLVPADKIYDVRFHLASEGLPHKAGYGFDSLEKESAFGTSRFMESARYRRALEGELARTISNLQDIKNARVHLAMPKESVFVDNNRQASASVLVDLVPGQKLNKNQVTAIAHLVSSSVPNLNNSEVTVVDQEGQLLSGGSLNDRFSQSKEDFDYKTQLENQYVKRIEGILTPLLGPGKVKARVSADIDFTQVEQTEETYRPDSKVIRSEQLINEPLKKGDMAGGVPGALSNQSPAAAGVTDSASLGKNTTAPNEEAGTTTRSQAIRNYELGKTISHAQMPVGQLKHLSVAVLLDEYSKVDSDTGAVTRTPLPEDQIKKITTLVENAVGYDAARGDKISVVSIPFVNVAPIEPLPITPIWKQAWVWQVAKISMGAIFVLLILLLILKPMMKNLASKAVDTTVGGTVGQQQMAGMPMGVLPPGSGGTGMMPGMGNPAMMAPQENWSHLQQMADDDPRRIAQVMKSWVGENK